MAEPIPGQNKKFDLLLAGGQVFMPDGTFAVADVAIAGGKILEVGRDLPLREARLTRWCTGKRVLPGLIDLHLHALFRPWGLEDIVAACLPHGVTTAVDAGTSNYLAIHTLADHIRRSRMRLRAFVNISSKGLMCGEHGELVHLDDAVPEEVAAVLDDVTISDLLLGVKVRQGGIQVGNNGVEPLKQAIRAAEMSKRPRPVMVHVADGPPLADILERLRPGDYVTHCYHDKAPEAGCSIVDTAGELLPQVRRARDNGVKFDVGHGKGSFHLRAARRAIANGFLPDTISSDLHRYCIWDLTYCLPWVMSKLLSLGMKLEDIVERVTAAPARMIGLQDSIGAIKPGMIADIAVMDLVGGNFTFHDCFGEAWTGDQIIQNCFTVQNGCLL